MFKKVSLLGLIGLLLLLGNSGYAKVEPNCEMGDAIFRDIKKPLVGWVGHVGIYFCSKSKPVEGTDVTVDSQGLITKIDIKESDMTHSMIQANGYKKDNPQWPPEIKEVDLVTLDFALDGLTPFFPG